MSKSNKKRGTFIHGIGASEHLDSSGERIRVEGIDITSLTKDGCLNFEHKSEEASQIVGKILEAKKILKRSDCTNDNHRHFWDQIKMPYLYVAGELFDAVGHSGAKDVAAMVKYDAQGHEKKESKNLINFSIEGSRLEKRGSEILKCIARKMTITLTPCNKVAIAEEMKRDDVNDSKAHKSDGDDFSFINDIIMEKGEHISSVKLAKATNWGEMGFINTNIKSEKVGKAMNYKPKRTFTPETAPDKMKVGDRIDHTQPKPTPKSGEYGNVVVKSKKKVKKGKIGESIKQVVGTLNVDATAKRVQRERERAGKPFDPDRTVVADKKRTILKAKVDRLAPEQQRAAARKQRQFFSPKKPTFTTEDARARTKTKEKMRATRQKLGKYDSNVRKAITASSGMGAPGTLTQGAALQSEEIVKPKLNKKQIKKIMKDISEESYKRFTKKEELFDFLSERLPNINDKEKMALAKAIAYIHEKKQELKLKTLVEDE